VVGVLNHVLANRTWLVRDKCTYADLAFVTWNNSIDYALKGGPTAWDINEFPNFKRWQEAMLDWDSVKKAVGVMAEKEVRSEGRLHVGNGELERGLGHHQS
jgi:glutathione S-transferase